MGIDPGTNLMGYGLLKVTDGKAQMITMGVIDLRKFPDAYLKLGHIFERVTGIIDGYLPDEMAIEAPFFGKNVQSMLKLGRAQGTAIAAAIHHGVPIHEYAPMKIKMAITGNGSAAKEQVAGMLQRLLKIPQEEMSKFMDATAVSYTHLRVYGCYGCPGSGLLSLPADGAPRERCEIQGLEGLCEQKQGEGLKTPLDQPREQEG